MSPSKGYIKDARYPATYFKELSPVWLNYVAAVCGAVPRKLDDPSLSYLELGCGSGNSSILHAAAFPAGEFHACDFNPDCIAAGDARAHALSVGNVRFVDASFDELLKRDLPDFDFIVLHGVYSWVSADVQRSIRQLIRKFLKPDGLVYVSYNCLPGWTGEIPLRKLIIELAAASEGHSLQRTEYAMCALRRLSTSGLEYFRANPSVTTAVEAYGRSDSAYLTHEFLNESWEPRYSIDVADEMLEAGIRYVGSATLVDNHEELILDASAAEAIRGLETARQRQLAVDFAVNRQFRRDVFVRPDRSTPQVDSLENLSQISIGCHGGPDTIGTTVQVPRGMINFHADFIRELRALMFRGPVPLGELIAALDGETRDQAEIVRNLLYLIAAGTFSPCRGSRD